MARVQTRRYTAVIVEHENIKSLELSGVYELVSEKEVTKKLDKPKDFVDYAQELGRENNALIEDIAAAGKLGLSIEIRLKFLV